MIRIMRNIGRLVNNEMGSIRMLDNVSLYCLKQIWGEIYYFYGVVFFFGDIFLNDFYIC